MNKKSLKTIEQLQKLVDERDSGKKYVRIKEITEKYQLGKRKIAEIARECGALYVINKLALIDVCSFEPYFRDKYMKEAK